MFTDMVEITREDRVPRSVAERSAASMRASGRRLTRRRVIDFMRRGATCCR